MSRVTLGELNSGGAVIARLYGPVLTLIPLNVRSLSNFKPIQPRWATRSLGNYCCWIGWKKEHPGCKKSYVLIALGKLIKKINKTRGY